MRERRYFKTIFGLLFGSALLMGCAGQNGVRTEELVGKTEEEINVGSLAKMASVHDPSIVKGKDDVYYIFGTHMSAAKSEDLVHWKSFADGVKIDNKLFSNLFTEGLPVFEFVGENSEGWYSVCKEISK